LVCLCYFGILRSISYDFKDKDGTGKEYSFNKNGAMTQDLNKGIDSIQYNYLNLPQTMVINAPTAKGKNYYTHSASGVKLKTEQRYDPTGNVTPVINTNPANDGLDSYKITDYVGNFIYEESKNGETVTNKVRILIDGGYIENGEYFFYIKDHLGNNRIVANIAGQIQQSNQYYPFGMSYADDSNQQKQAYKYNGKEFDDMHGLNWYDYSARHYDPTVPRFTSVDPHAENYYAWSPYHYAANNPLRITDPTGMDWFVNNENGNVVFLKGVSELTDRHRDQYGLGTSKYENLGNDSFFGNEMEYGHGKEHRGKVSEQQFLSLGVYSEDFMLAHGYEKGYRNIVLERVQTTTTVNEANPMFDVVTKIPDKLELLGKTEYTYSKPENMNKKNVIDKVSYSMGQEIKIDETVYSVTTRTHRPSSDNNSVRLNNLNSLLSIIGDFVNSIYSK